MTDFENKISTVEGKPKSPEKKVGVQESLKDLTRNIISKFDRLLSNFKSSDKELEEIDKSIDLPPAEIKDIKEEMKITENVDVLNNEAEEIVEEAVTDIDDQVNNVILDSKGKIKNVATMSENELAADRAHALIVKGDFELARENLLLIDDDSAKEKIITSNRDFFEYYENYEMNKSKGWLDDKNNQVDAGFNAKEGVKDILKQPSGEERKFALDNYKNNLVRQKEALTNFELYQESLMKNKPETDEKVFSAELDKYSKNYSFSEEQKKEYIEVFEEFKKRQNFINDSRNKFPKDDDLFEFFSLEKPEGKIQILYRSGTIAFRCEKMKDFNALMLRGTNDQPNVKNMTGFCATRRIEDFRSSEPENNKISLSVIGELVEGEFKEIKSCSSSSTLVHEEQHAVRSMFGGPKDKQYEFRENEFSDIKKIQVEINRILDHEAQGQLLNQGAGVADEILARVKERPFDPGDIGRELKSYNFKEELENDETKGILKGKFDKLFSDDRNIAANSNIEVIDKFEIELVNEHLRHYLAHQHEKNVANAIEAVNSLYKNYSNHQICALLMNENIFDWPKIAKRILETKN